MSVFIYNHLSLFFPKPHNEPLNGKFLYYINIVLFLLLRKDFIILARRARESIAIETQTVEL